MKSEQHPESVSPPPGRQEMESIEGRSGRQGSGLVNIVTSGFAWEALAHELVGKYAHSKVVVAVDGVDAASRVHFANALARAVRVSGRPAVRLTAAPFTDDETIRAVSSMFMAGTLGNELEDVSGQAMLIVDGWSLLRSSVRSAWDYGVFLEANHRLSEDVSQRHMRYLAEDSPCEAADAAFDVSEIHRPARITQPRHDAVHVDDRSSRAHSRADATGSLTVCHLPR